ncbi:MAG: efflux RND transporter periplasmic adaptor subunit [Chitinophagaceae bacterium]|nr:MAG: efflux RND transporter periplasmic adaptor subunit [Chitinophagaceae bacterium]
MKKNLFTLGLVFYVTFSACTVKKEEKTETGKYTVTSPVLMDTSFTKEYVAQIQSLQNIEIRAKVKGFIETINVDEGQVVKKGQLLFTIRPREYEAELAKAQAQVKTAELEMQNVKTLADKGIVSKNELALSVAKLNEVKAESAMAELYVSYTKITAPFDGIIDRLKFKAGSLIDEGTLLTTLSNNKEVYAYFNVTEQEYLDFKTQASSKSKMAAKLLLANNQPHKYKGAIETIEGEFDNNTGTIAFRAKFPNPELLLKHGETGKVQLTVDLKNALIIPQKATFEVQDKMYVFVVDQNNVVKTRGIVIKQKISNIYIIESGIQPTDKILLEGIQSVKEDEKIESVFVSPQQALILINKQ